jgi:hypothetical protein
MESKTCPHCGWETDELPEPVTYEFDRGQYHVRNGIYDDPDEVPGSRYVEKTKGHSDQKTIECPECGEEGWHIGWLLDEE